MGSEEVTNVTAEDRSGAESIRRDFACNIQPQEDKTDVASYVSTNNTAA
ncbi:MAG TPA: hypothetical protein VKA07_09725 [Candidatus Sulfotelmatobacter sp.]|nr:hypothetical protein [Candidatus Sulfotelmatobacter sp.]